MFRPFYFLCGDTNEQTYTAYYYWSDVIISCHGIAMATLKGIQIY